NPTLAAVNSGTRLAADAIVQVIEANSREHWSMRHSKYLIAFTAATLIVSGCSVIKGKETTGQYVDDATLLTRAKAALVKDSTVSATDFNIDVYKGDVTLSGVAKSPGEIDRAISDI